MRPEKGTASEPRFDRLVVDRVRRGGLDASVPRRTERTNPVLACGVCERAARRVSARTSAAGAADGGALARGWEMAGTGAPG